MDHVSNNCIIVTVPVCGGEAGARLSEKPHCLLVIYFLVLTYGHELWVVLKGMRSRTVAEINFHSRGHVLTVQDRVRSSAI